MGIKYKHNLYFKKKREDIKIYKNNNLSILDYIKKYYLVRSGIN